jgi:predicted transcriptional regulator
MDLLDDGLSNADAARKLDISPSAVSQRLSAASREEAHRGEVLAARLLARLQAHGERTAV